MTRYMRLAATLVLAALGGLAAAGCSRSADAYLESGNAFYAEGKYAEALVEYRNAVEKDAAHGPARLRLAQTHEQLEQWPQAVREYIRAADLLPDDAATQVKAGTFLLLGRDFEAARARAERALAVDAANVDAQILLGNATAGLKDLDGAVREIQEAITLSPGEGRGYANLGAIQLAQGDAEAAEAAFRKAVEVEPSSVQAHLALGNFLWSVNRRDEAAAALQQALSLEPANLMANRLMASFHLSGTQPELAEPYFKRLAEESGDQEARLALGDYYLRLNRVDEGRRVLLEAAAQQQTFAPASRRLAALAFAEGRKTDAYQLIGEVLEKNPKDSEALVLRGRFEQADGEADKARLTFQEAVAAQPSDVAAQYALGVTEAQARNTDAAVAAFSEVLRLNPRAAAAQLQLAQLYLARGEVQQSATMSEDALRNAPGNPMARLLRARTQMAQGQFADANAAMAALEKEFPNAWPVLAQSGTLKALQNDLPGARRAWERAIAIAPEAFEAQRGLARLELAEKKPEAAVGRLRRLTEQFPKDARYRVELARVVASQRNFAEAEQALRAAIEIDPAAMEAYGMLGQVYLAQNRTDEAIREFETITQKDPKAIGPHTLIAMILQAKGRGDEALKRYEQVVQIDRRAAVASNNLAWMYAAEGKGNLDQALELAQAAIEVLPDQPEVNDTLAYIYLKKQIPTLAVPPMLRAVDKDPTNPTYHYRLGQAYLESGSTEKAKQSLEAALKLSADFPEAAEARALLTRAGQS